MLLTLPLNILTSSSHRSFCFWLSFVEHTVCMVHRNVHKNNKVVFCWTICCPSQLRHESIYQHKLLVYHLFMIWRLCLEPAEVASLTPLLYNLKAWQATLHVHSSYMFSSCAVIAAAFSHLAADHSWLYEKWAPSFTVQFESLRWLPRDLVSSLKYINTMFCYRGTLEDCNWSGRCWRWKAINHFHVLFKVVTSHLRASC